MKHQLLTKPGSHVSGFRRHTFRMKKPNSEKKTNCMEFSFSLADLLWLVVIAGLFCVTMPLRNSLFNGFGVIIKAYSLLMAIYLIRLRLLIRFISTRSQIIRFVSFLVVLMPIVYCFVNLLKPPFQLGPHKWIGDPIWVFVVPTLSFFVFDVGEVRPSVRNFVIRSLCELFIVFPAWTYFWIFAQLYLVDVFL